MNNIGFFYAKDVIFVRNGYNYLVCLSFNNKKIIRKQIPNQFQLCQEPDQEAEVTEATEEVPETGDQVTENTEEIEAELEDQMREAELLDEAKSDHNEGLIVEVPDYDGDITQVPEEGKDESTEVPNESVPEESESVSVETNEEVNIADNQGNTFFNWLVS